MISSPHRSECRILVRECQSLGGQYKGETARGKVFLEAGPARRRLAAAYGARQSRSGHGSQQEPPAIFRALSLAFQQLPDPAFRRILFLGLGLSLVVFAVLGTLIAVGFHYMPAMRWHWLDDLVALGGVIGFLVAMWLLFPAVVSLFIGLLLDDVAEAVERRHYPQDPPGAAPSLGLSVLLSLRLMAALIVLNIIVLPIYIVALFIPFLSLALFLALNGYLLGREYFELVATRHMSAGAARVLRKRSAGRVYLAGMVIAGLFAVPFLNLLAPILGAAFMMHVYKALSAGQNSSR